MSSSRIKWINCTVSLHSKICVCFMVSSELATSHFFVLSSTNEDLIQELREETKALQSYLDSANEELQVLVLVNRI